MNPTDTRQHSPAAERNQAVLLPHLQRLLPPTAKVLEIASGTGQHAAHFAGAMPAWQWQPSDPSADARASIVAWCAASPGVLPPLALDVMTAPWPVPAATADTAFDAVFCANMIHISPWPTCAALMQGSQRCLRPGGLLLLYGPFIEDGVPTAPSNLAFDADLRQRNPQWGLRALNDVLVQAQTCQLSLAERVSLPANNLLLVLRAA